MDENVMKKQGPPGEAVLQGREVAVARSTWTMTMRAVKIS